MIYQQPLAYLLGLEGAALLRAWVGDYDREFVEVRLAEIRRLLANDSLVDHDGFLVRRAEITTGYRQMSAIYDEGRNSLFDFDEPIVHEILDGFPAGVALDAACGTGRFAAHLVELGHRVVGVDGSPDMLDRARARVPRAAFLPGDLHRLPLPDGSVDVVACGLALTHVPDLRPVLAEFARVLRPGGHLVISDVHHELVLIGSAINAPGPAGEPGRVVAHRHTAGDFLRAALAVGLRVRRCEEPRYRLAEPLPPADPDAAVGDWADWPWTLMAMVPEAVWAIGGPDGLPQTIIWHFQAPDG